MNTSESKTARLDDAYANMAHIADGASYPARWTHEAAQFRERGLCELGLSYGHGTREVYDLFHPARLARGVLVFVHGGYWKAFDRSLWSHLAAGAVTRGWAVAMPSYDLCPDVRIGAITRQISKAVDAIAARVPGPVVLSGHSAGGHLAARMGCADIALGCRARVASILPISPLADLAPLMETSMNAELRIDAAEAKAESPIHHPAPDCPVSVWVGGAERPAFIDQARWLAAAWECPMITDEGRHHFDVIDAMRDPWSPLTEALVGT